MSIDVIEQEIIHLIERICCECNHCSTIETNEMRVIGHTDTLNQLYGFFIPLHAPALPFFPSIFGEYHVTQLMIETVFILALNVFYAIAMLQPQLQPFLHSKSINIWTMFCWNVHIHRIILQSKCFERRMLRIKSAEFQRECRNNVVIVNTSALQIVCETIRWIQHWATINTVIKMTQQKRKVF